MIGYETEEQQVQAIKQFWKDNGFAIVAGALIGLGMLWGWRYYNDSQIAAKEEASSAYQTSVESMIDNDNTEQLVTFLEEKKGTGYAPLAALILAQDAAKKNDFDEAKRHLITATEGDEVIADVARLRLANLHIQLDENDEALSVLSAVVSVSFDNQVEELKGDALLAKGEFESARNAYTLAMAQSPNNPNLKMKRDNIAYAKTQTTGDDVE